MNHMDRKSVGIEMLFAAMSSITSKANELTPEETVERICDLPYEARKKIAVMINTGIRKLTSEQSIDVSAYLDKSIIELSKHPLIPESMNRSLPFFKWLMEIQRKNSLAMSQGFNSLNDAASHMDKNAGEFLRAYSEISGQSFSITSDDDGSIVMQTTEKAWGQAELVFPDVKTKFNGALPIFGFLFWIDAEYTGSRFHFSIIIDVEFSDTDSRLRSVQDRNWVRLDFDCATPYMRINSRNYAKLLKLNGYCGHDFVNAWSDEITVKAGFLGTASLNEKEKKLLPFAYVMKYLYKYSEGGFNGDDMTRDEMQLFDKVLRAMENRYNFGEIEKLLKSVGEEKLYEKFSEAVDEWQSGDYGMAQIKLNEMSAMLYDNEKNGSALKFYHKLEDIILDSTSEFEGRSLLYNSYPLAHESIKAMLEPELKKRGFEGEYPHYHRRRGKKGEYISIRMSDMVEHPIGGMMRYRFQLSAAVKKLKASKDKNYMAGDFSYQDVTAEDFRYILPKTARFAELGGDYDSMINVVELDAYKHEQSVNVDSSEMLLKLIEIADNAMRGKKIPKWYRVLRKHSNVKPKSFFDFSDAIMRYLPVGLYLAVLLIGAYLICDTYYINITSYYPILSGEIVMIASVLLGMVVTLMLSIMKMHSLNKKIWRH